MKITFLLPFSGHLPVGGFKVAYEYAGGLAANGHQVTVLHAPARRIGPCSLGRNVRSLAAYAVRGLGLAGGYLPAKWFRIDPRVRMLWRPSLAAAWTPRADLVVATSWETAEWADRYPEDRGRKFYLIQHNEATFPGADPDRATATLKMPFSKIVIARWLAEMVESLGETCAYIPNGLDFSTFDLDIPPADRDPYRLIMLYHHLTWKGSADGLEAIRRVKEKVPELKVGLFGIPPRPATLPAWIDYDQRPSPDRLRSLYNEASIFIGPSWAEGWPLPPAEAAQCGSALCLTDIGGHREYGIHCETALLSPVKDPAALAENLLSLVTNNQRRILLAEQGHAYIRQFTWKRAVASLESAFQGSSCIA